MKRSKTSLPAAKGLTARIASARALFSGIIESPDPDELADAGIAVMERLTEETLALLGRMRAIEKQIAGGAA